MDVDALAQQVFLFFFNFYTKGTMVVLVVEHLYVFNSEVSLFLVGIFFCHWKLNLGSVSVQMLPWSAGIAKTTEISILAPFDFFCQKLICSG